MATHRPLSEIKRQAPEAVLAGLRDPDFDTSRKAGLRLAQEAAGFGLDMTDYLILSVDPRLSEKNAQFQVANGQFLNGLEASMLHLQLPFRNDFENGVTIQAASDTFQTFAGTRLLFPAVVDSMVKWTNRMNMVESVAALVSSTRTINGAEMISEVIEDDSERRRTSTISELGRIPVRSIKSSNTTVNIYKHGSGIRTSYEFSRRASIDVLIPFANRVQRELEISKVNAATYILINGDGVNGAATVVDYSDFGGTPFDGSGDVLLYKPIVKWLTARAKAGVPVDTVVGNWEMYVEWIFLFTPGVNNRSDAEAIAAQGGPRIVPSLPILNGDVTFALSSAMPGNQLLGMTRGETLEELVEAGSDISESERIIQNQSIEYYRTQNSGFKLAWADTRSILDLEA